MALLPEGHDIPFLLGRLRPNAEWGWRGIGGGNAHRQTANVDWRDSVQIEPTEQEYLDEQLLVNAEEVTQETTRADQLTRITPLVGQNPRDLAPPETGHLVEELAVRLGALDEHGNIMPLDEWGSRNPTPP